MKAQGLGDEWKRENWGPGPWTDEPDRLDWRDATTGYTCVALRNIHHELQVGPGNWCGYVAVAPGHPYHGLGMRRVRPYLDVHGGVTFAEGELVEVAGAPANAWWFGFDCNHGGQDLAPGLVASFSVSLGRAEAAEQLGGEYRTLPFVQEQCELLAAQLRAVELVGRGPGEG